MHLSAAQQPPVHEVAVHVHAAPPQVSPLAHPKHAVPFLPHCADPLPVIWQTWLASQQPLGQVVALHSH
jgi:hypothetical protein